MTPLRQRMTEDMQLRGLAPATQQAYLRYVEQLAVFTGKSPDLVTDEDFRQFFLALHPALVVFLALPRRSLSLLSSSFSKSPSSAPGRVLICFVRVRFRPYRSSSASMRSGAFLTTSSSRPTTPASPRFDHLRPAYQRGRQPPGQLDRQRSHAAPGSWR